MWQITEKSYTLKSGEKTVAVESILQKLLKACCPVENICYILVMSVGQLSVPGLMLTEVSATCYGMAWIILTVWHE